MKISKRKEIKKFIQFNKRAIIYFIVFFSYTLFMLGIIFIFGKDMNKCSSGSLSSIVNKEETSTTEQKELETKTENQTQPEN